MPPLPHPRSAPGGPACLLHCSVALPPEDTVGSAWVEEGAEGVGVAVGVKPIVGVAGVDWELGEVAVELKPVVLGVAVVGLASVEGKPE